MIMSIKDLLEKRIDNASGMGSDNARKNNKK
jgi:hypothetical protein